MSRYPFWRVASVLLVVVCLWGHPGFGAASAVDGATWNREVQSKEYSIKAAFVFNFLKYAAWPKGTFKREGDPIVLGIVGKDPFGSLLDKALAKKKIGKRAVVIRRFQDVTKVERVHALFLGELPAKERSKLYALLADKPVLTIGDSRGLAGADSCVASFFLLKGKVRFEVSTKALARTKLTLSSQLLKLADIVEKRN